MARLNDVQRAALANWWNLAIDAASTGLLSTDMVAAASDIAAQAGRSITFQEGQALAVLYGYARRMANAAGELQAAPDTAVIGAEMIAVPPWARDEQVMNTTPIWHVQFTFEYLDANGELHSEYRTSKFYMTLPDTVGELADMVNGDALAMADKYKVTLQGATLHSILAV